MKKKRKIRLSWEGIVSKSLKFDFAKENVNYEIDNTLLKKWETGQTGFPFVDAGMRQMNKTGYMHNRGRMIVASFLTKDLLIERYYDIRKFFDNVIAGVLVLFVGLAGGVLLYRAATSESKRAIFLAGGFALMGISLFYIFQFTGRA